MSSQLEQVLENLQGNLEFYRGARDEAQVIVERWAGRIQETEESIAEVQAALRFGVKVGDVVEIKGRGWNGVLETGVVEYIGPSLIEGEVSARIRTPEGVLRGYTLDRYMVNVQLDLRQVHGRLNREVAA